MEEDDKDADADRADTPALGPMIQPRDEPVKILERRIDVYGCAIVPVQYRSCCGFRRSVVETGFNS